MSCLLRGARPRKERCNLIRQAALIGLSVVPFAVSSALAFAVWWTFAIPSPWRMIMIVLVWIGDFAACTQLFWIVVRKLAAQH